MLRSIAAALALSAGLWAHAQMGFSIRTVLKNGDFAALQGQSDVQLQFTYDGMTVGKFTEENYVKKKTAEYNEKEKGRGDEWAAKWVAARTAMYEPKFEELLNERLAKEKLNLKASRNASGATYFLKVHTTETEPGFNIGITRQPGFVTATITLHESASPEAVLGEVEIQRAPAQTGMGMDFDTGGRIAEGYAKMGKELGAWLKKSDWGRKL